MHRQQSTDHAADHGSRTHVCGTCPTGLTFGNTVTNTDRTRLAPAKPRAAGRISNKQPNNSYLPSYLPRASYLPVMLDSEGEMQPLPTKR